MSGLVFAGIGVIVLVISYGFDLDGGIVFWVAVFRGIEVLLFFVEGKGFVFIC